LAWLSPGGVLLSYLIAAIFIGTGILAAWAWKVSDRAQPVAKNTPQRQASETAAPLAGKEAAVVGRITGMKDCVWAVRTPTPKPGDAVHADDFYALDAGLLEISYSTGAKVILQSHVAYLVESENSGRLLQGRMTVHFEKKNDGAEAKGASRQLAAGNRQTSAERSEAQVPSPSSQPRPLPAPPFLIHTPLATVIDRSAAFGVEVSGSRYTEPDGELIKPGVTYARVFAGEIEVQVRTAAPLPEVFQLKENEWTTVQYSPSENLVSVLAPSRVQPPDTLVRRMPRPEPNQSAEGRDPSRAANKPTPF
jgi:hypothetical protein